MEIKSSKPGWKREQRKNRDFLSTVLNHVFAIAKTDKNFSVREENMKLDDRIKSLNTKVVKQQKLLDQANGIQSETTRKIKDLDEQNFAMKSRLLEILGSEI